MSQRMKIRTEDGIVSQDAAKAEADASKTVTEEAVEK